MSSCTSLPENPVKVVVDIPSRKPTIYSFVSCPVHLPILRAHPNTRQHQDISKASSLTCIEWKYKDPGYPCHFVVEFRPKRSSDESWMQR